MIKRIKLVMLGIAAIAAFPAMAQPQQAPTAVVEKTTLVVAPQASSYDPLVPQLFAMDSEGQVFASINAADNTIDIRKRKDTMLMQVAQVLVDVVRKRHDDYAIYRPKSVAIYEGHVVYLASNRDSCYLEVLNFDGKIEWKMKFAGAANAFSYSPSAQELYIAGDNVRGYDIAVLDASNGFADLRKVASSHYRQPRKSEVIAKFDQYGIGIAAVAMSVVFLALLLLFLVFKNVGKTLIKREKRRHVGTAPTAAAVASAKGDTHGEVYAAIAAAIHLYNEELHDEESTVLTINKVSRAYSPWSSKIHGLNTYFNGRTF